MKVQQLVLAMVIGIAGSSTWAADDVQTQLQAMQAQMQTQQAQMEAQSAEINRLRAAAGETWLNERRAEEIKTLVREVLSDAETRASLMDSAVTAGHNGEHFFLASEDGNFLLQVSGQVQTRYIYNHIDEEDVDRTTDSDKDNDEDTEGFQLRRAKVRFDGHVVNPQLTYAVQITNDYTSDYDPEENLGSHADDSTLIARVEEAWAAYDFADGWNVKMGLFKAPFMHDELVDSKYQLAIERAYVTDYFTVDYTEGVQLSYSADQWRAAAMIHDGSYMDGSDYNSDLSDIAIAARAEILLMGDWGQTDDYTTWSGQPSGLLLGGGIDYENGAELDPGVNGVDIFKWTVDLSYENADFHGFNASIAVVGASYDTNGGGPTALDSSDQLGLIAQAAIFIQPDKWDVYFRYEYIDFDEIAYIQMGDYTGFADTRSYGSDDEDQTNIFTFGTNYYFSKHAAKATFDVVWVDGPLPFADTGAGLDRTDLSGDDDIEQLALRAQFQLLF